MHATAEAPPEPARADPPRAPEAPEPTAAPADEESHSRLSAAGVDAALVVVVSLAAFYLVPIFWTGARLPLGSDAAYYTWMTRLAGGAGLGPAGFRAGAHALLLGASSTSGLSPLQAIAPLDVALEISLGLAAAAVVTVVLGFRRATFITVGVLTSAFAARMATGYLANLLFMVLFLAALALLMGDRRRGTLVLGTAMLVAAGLAHAPFLAFGDAVLVGAVVLGRLLPARDRAVRRLDERRVLVAVGASGLVLGGLLAAGRISIGGTNVLHSGDAIMRAVGLQDLLHAEFSQRFPGAVAAAGLVAVVPLAAWGAWFARRRVTHETRLPGLVLASWAASTVAGVGVGLATGWIPPGRVLGVAVWLPILAAVGVLGVASSLSRHRAARLAVAAVLVLGLLVAPFRSVIHSNVTASPDEIGAVSAAGRYASSLPPGTPLVYLVNLGRRSPAFDASRLENLARMGLPADRMDDVFLYVGSPSAVAAGRPGLDSDAIHNLVARLYARRAEAALARPHAVLLLRPFDERDWSLDPSAGRSIGSGVRVIASPPVGATPVTAVALGTISPAGRLVLSVVFLLAFCLVGLPLVRWGTGRFDSAVLALGPAVGAGAVTLFVAAAVAALH